MGDKLAIIAANGETLVGWSIINLILQMGLVQSVELGNLIIFTKSAQIVISL